MCEIFPEVANCCLVFSYRIGMLFIAVWAIITGSVSLSILEMTSDASFDHLKNVSEIRKPEDALSQVSQIIPTSITGMSALFMLMGLVLLFATLTDQEGFAQVFVWGTFVAVIVGFFLILGICFECTLTDVCLLGSMDWLSASGLLVLLVGYLFLWIYFISVANSYVINGD